MICAWVRTLGVQLKTCFVVLDVIGWSTLYGAGRKLVRLVAVFVVRENPAKKIHLLIKIVVVVLVWVEVLETSVPEGKRVVMKIVILILLVVMHLSCVRLFFRRRMYPKVLSVG
jgi:hypothetical protein